MSWKAILLNLALLLVLCTATTVSLNFAIDNLYSHKFIRTLLNEKIKTYTSIKVDFDSMKASFFPLGLELKNVKIIHDQDILFSSDDLKTELSWFSLFIQDPALSLVKLKNPKFLWTSAFSQKKLIKIPLPKSEGTPWSFRFVPKQIVIENMELAYDSEDEKTHKPDIHLKFKGMNLTLQKSWGRHLDFKFSSEEFDFEHEAISLLKKAQIKIDGNARDKDITMETFFVKNEEFHANGSVTTSVKVNEKKFIQELITKGKLKATGDLKILGRFLDTEKTEGITESQVDLDLSIPFEDDKSSKLNILTDTKIQHGFLHGYNLHDSQVKLRITNDFISFHEGKFIAGKDHFGDFIGKLGFSDETPFDFKARIKKLSLVKLFDTVKVDFDKLDAATSIQNLVVKGIGEPFHMKISGKVALQDFNLPTIKDFNSNPNVTPSCKGEVLLDIKDPGLSLNKSNLHCFVHDREKNLDKEVGGQIDVSGGLDFIKNKMDIHFKSSNFPSEIGSYFIGLPMSGKINIDTRLHGPFGHVLVSNTFKAKDVRYHNTFTQQAQGEVTIDYPLISWKDVYLDTPGKFHLSSKSGSVDVESKRYKIDLKGEKIDALLITQIIKTFSKDHVFACNVDSLTANLEGTYDNFLASLGQAHFKVRNVDYDTSHLADDLEVRLESQNRKSKVDITRYQIGSLKLVSLIELQKDKNPSKGTVVKTSISPLLQATHMSRFNMKIRSEHDIKPREYEIDELSKLPYVGKILGDLGLTGKLNLHGELQGSLQGLKGKIEADVTNHSIHYFKMPQIHMDFKFNNTKMNASLRQGFHLARADINVDLMERDFPFDWKINLTDYDLRPYIDQSMVEKSSVISSFSGDWIFSGKFGKFWESKGSILLKDIWVKLQKEINSEQKEASLRLKDPVSIMIDQGRWALKEKQELILRSRFMHLKVLLEGNRLPENLNVKIKGDLDLHFLSFFFTPIESAGGKILLDAGLTGPLSDPKFFMKVGTPDFKGLPSALAEAPNITIQEQRPKIENISFHAEYQNSTLFLKDFKAEKGGGQIVAQGLVNFSSNSSHQEGQERETSSLDINFNHVKTLYPLPYLKTFEVLFSGDLHLSGQNVPYLLSGDIKIEKAKSLRNVDIKNEIIHPLKRDRISFKDKLVKKQALNFDVTLDANKTISIQNKTLNALLSSELRITGNDIEPKLAGYIRVERGSMTYKKKFNITRGELVFNDLVNTTPKIDFVGTANIGEYLTSLVISGDVSNPEVEILVDPSTKSDGTPITKLDRLILLSTGKIPNQSSPISSAQGFGIGITEAINLYSSQSIEDIMDQLKFDQDLFFLDFDFATDTQGAPVPQLKIRLNLLEKVDTLIKRTPTRTEFSTEIPLHDNVSITGNIIQDQYDKNTTNDDERDNTSFDLRFRFPIK